MSSFFLFFYSVMHHLMASSDGRGQPNSAKSNLSAQGLLCRKSTRLRGWVVSQCVLLGEVDFSICKGSISDKTPSALCVYLLIECNHFPGLPAEGSEIRSGHLTIFPVTTLSRLVEIQFCWISALKNAANF